MRVVSVASCASSIGMGLVLVATFVSVAQAQHIEAMELQQRAIAHEDAARARSAAIKRANSAAKKQQLLQLRIFQESIIAPSKSDLTRWQKVSSPQGIYWKYSIRRTKGPIATLYYYPKYGYSVNNKAQGYGLGWSTMDEALEQHFGHNALYGLPDIPGWAKAHVLTREEHLADLQRQALNKAKPIAVDRMAGRVADGIVKDLGPKVGEGIGRELGMDNPLSD